MNKIIINRGSFKIKEMVFEQGTTSIGRARNNTIILDDTAVSSHHAKIVTLFNTSYIEDLDSTNGTMVNGKSVQKRTLYSGDIISLGNHQLLFQSDDARNRKANETSDTVMLNSSEIKQRLTDFIQAQAEIQNNSASVTPEPRSTEASVAVGAHDNAANTRHNAGAPPNTAAAIAGNTSTGNSTSNSTSNNANSFSKDNNQRWLDAKRHPWTEAPAAPKQALKDNPKPLMGSDKSVSEMSPPSSPQISRNTADVKSITPSLNNFPVSDTVADPAANTAADTAALTTENSATQKIPLDIAVAARSALQSRRTGDAGKNSAPAPMPGKPSTVPPHQNLASRNRAATNNIAPIGFPSRHGAAALSHRQRGNRILAMIWLIIAAVLVVEVIYITYRSVA